MFEPAALRRVLPFFVYLAFIFVADMAERLGLGPAELRWLYPVKILAVVAVLAWCWRSYEELRDWRLGWGGCALAVAVGLVVLVLWINLDAGWMQVGTSAGYDPRTDGRIDWLLVVIRIAGAALVVPVMEELFWRSFLMRWIAQGDFLRLDPARAGLKAVVISVVLFGIEHNLWFAGMVAGAAYSLLYMRSRNLWAPIVAHGITNGALGVWVVMTGQWTYW
ncbi:CAAX prenyl protease-related protein [Duganella sp. HH105]|uniref:CAAX prenyl protease-related protein n=1 Tax=Duganella sp. HH105 TaxID=1781067 RepID=UPI000877B545|nr:CAAX prenyl protease-related protein [Duganella sp. HH105]OEZ61633.1 CAAX amino terminal protease self- immunity [Duganella sp. HH105]